jgi:hypothetical protein
MKMTWVGSRALCPQSPLSASNEWQRYKSFSPQTISPVPSGKQLNDNFPKLFRLFHLRLLGDWAGTAETSTVTTASGTSASTVSIAGRDKIGISRTNWNSTVFPFIRVGIIYSSSETYLPSWKIANARAATRVIFIAASSWRYSIVINEVDLRICEEGNGLLGAFERWSVID